MKLSISHKLFAAFLGLTLLVLLATLGLARWSFERGFLDYVNALEQQRLTRMAEHIARRYQQVDGDWQQLDREHLSALLHRVPGKERRKQGRPFKHKPPKFPPPKPLPGHKVPETALLDLDDQHLAGSLIEPQGTGLIRVPVLIKGQVVAYLVSIPKRRLESAQETAFSRQQLLTSMVIGGLALLFAVLVSWLLARTLLAPVKRMMTGVQQLADGHYQHRLHDRGNDELAQLMQDIDRLAQTLEDNQSAQRRWLADISHELRTPVTVLQGEIEALKDGVREFNASQLVSFDQEVQRLRHLIEDLYQLSLADVGGLRYSFEVFDLYELLEDMYTSFAMRAEAAGITLHLQTSQGLLVKADDRRLQQLFINVLENALAYTDVPGEIQVSAYRQDGDICVVINDTAPGVPDEQCEKLFEPLHRQESSRNRRRAGAGLGLAICRSIVDAHQGQIIASPSQLGGLSVLIRLPAVPQK